MPRTPAYEIHSATAEASWHASCMCWIDKPFATRTFDQGNMQSDFRGSFTVMVTPFAAKGSLDEPALRRFVDWQIEQGTQGLIPLGSTGEFLSLTREERTRVVTIVVEQARRRVPVLVGTPAEWPREAVDLSREAQALGADGVMVVPPYYSCPTEDELFAHYKAIGEALSIPVMVYNNPNTANVGLGAELVALLRR